MFLNPLDCQPSKPFALLFHTQSYFYPSRASQAKIEAERDAARDADADLVGEELGCPLCGNCAMDKLVWSSDYEHITCVACGITYTLEE